MCLVNSLVIIACPLCYLSLLSFSCDVEDRRMNSFLKKSIFFSGAQMTSQEDTFSSTLPLELPTALWTYSQAKYAQAYSWCVDCGCIISFTPMKEKT